MRAWRGSDIERLAAIADDERIAAWMSDTWPEPYTAADARWWVQEGQFSMGHNWALCHDDVPCGGLGLHLQSGFLRCNAEVGWWLAPEHWGRGAMLAAARELLAQCWAQPEVTRVFAPIHAGNARSMRLAEKLGMRLEAVQRRSAFKRGLVIDRHVWAIHRAAAEGLA
jgi:[ribosomal protein S5]-alanine N-acetyltransferase